MKALIAQFDPTRPLSGAAYLAAGAVLFAIKFFFDSMLAARFNIYWDVFHYWLPHASMGAYLVPREIRLFYFFLSLLSLPFVAVGVLLTLRRLRTLGWPLRTVLLFFVPFVNLPFFLILGLRRRPSPAPAPLGPEPGGRCSPHPLVGAAVAGLFGVVVARFAIEALFTYGMGLFIGLPFAMGYVASAICNYPRPRSHSASLLAALGSVLVAGSAFFLLGWEGLICLLMLLPVAVPLALLGGSLAHFAATRSAPQKTITASLILLLPLAIVAESLRVGYGDLRPVTSSVVVQASAGKVWENVVTFSPIRPPRQLLFRAGVAYPTHAVIHGTGPGAVRHCVFSTGAFIEPIEEWKPGELLRFSVTAQPPVMREFSPYPGLEPPHVRHEFLRSRAGEFRLTPLADGTTLLEGTTWYELRFSPQWYWTLWSDAIIHRIHLRVLQHIKKQAESSPMQVAARGTPAADNADE